MAKRRKSGLAGHIKKWLWRLLLSMVVIWLGGILIFAVLPVPFSAVMAERQLSSWFRGDFSYVARSEWVSHEEVSPWMLLAVMAAEDQRFPQHNGFDLEAIKTVLQGGERREMRGASTISQQTAKNMFLWSGRSWIRKGLEVVLTTGMEVVWSKQRILIVYLNIAEFGDGIFGVEQAAQHYFHKSARHLTMSEAALLAAVLPAPHRFSVATPSRYTLQRQQWIIRQMQQLGGKGFLMRHKLSS